MSNGVRVTRLTDASELAGTSNAYIVYSRYTPENTNGDLFLSFGDNSASSWVSNRTSGTVLAQLVHTNGATIGENHEVRFDLSGNYPYTAYYRYGTGFYKIPDVRTPVPELVRDFAATSPSSTLIYNDVEGDSSNNSGHWAWMAAHYNGSTYVVDKYIHYNMYTDTVHTLVPDDLAGTNLAGEVGRTTFTYRPNMVEMSPDGTKFIMHHGRKWDDSAYGGNGIAWIGTWYDGAHAWPVDFDYATTTPVKISVGETHSGWAYRLDGKLCFVSQNNRTDMLDAIAADGTGPTYAAPLIIGSHAEQGWVNGFHYGKMPPSRPGWALLGTYSNIDSPAYDTGYAVDGIFMMQMIAGAGQVVIPIGSTNNRYAGSYRDEGPVAVNMHGNRLYISSNWGGTLGHSEVFVYELPDNWDTWGNAQVAA